MEAVRHHRVLRKAFVTKIVIVDVASELGTSSHTSDLSLQGCFVPTSAPLNPGVRVRTTLSQAGAKVVAQGRVVYSRAEGMGIAFTEVEPSDQEVLERWMTDLRVK